MNISQLKALGIATNKWDNLQNLCKAILFDNDGYLYVTPRTKQFYFDEENELVFVREIRTPLSKNEFEDSVKVTLVEGTNKKEYYGKLHAGGIVDNKVGKYHAVYDIGKINSIIF